MTIATYGFAPAPVAPLPTGRSKAKTRGSQPRSRQNTIGENREDAHS